MNAPTNTPTDTSAKPANTALRRIAAVAIISAVLFLLLWTLAFSALTSVLVASGFCIVVAGASAVSDAVELVVDAIALVIFGILGVIAAIFAAILGIFGW